MAGQVTDGQQGQHTGALVHAHVHAPTREQGLLHSFPIHLVREQNLMEVGWLNPAGTDVPAGNCHAPPPIHTLPLGTLEIGRILLGLKQRVKHLALFLFFVFSLHGCMCVCC